MSTLIGKFTGLKEIENSNKYVPQELVLNSFYGGENRGKSLQVKIGLSYTQLDNNQVKDLIKLLKEHYDN